jgi:hypothetical protein
MTGFFLPIGDAVLNNADGINPDVLKTKVPRDLDGVSKGKWELFKRNPYPVLIKTV